MNFEPRIWHKRFVQQAGWTKEIRHYILRTLHASRNTFILEVGCGTGAVLAQIFQDGYRHVFGVDIALSGLTFAHDHNPHLRLTCADGFKLPFPNRPFAITLCHYFLLWVTDPLAIMLEMKRVTRKGGFLVILAEPDYQSRKDEPPELRKVGELQNQALQSLGAYLDMGKQVRSLFEKLQLQDIHVSMLKPTSMAYSPKKGLLEHQVIASDLQTLLTQGAISQEEFMTLKLQDEEAWQNGTRRLYIPTYFGWAKVP